MRHAPSWTGWKGPKEHFKQLIEIRAAIKTQKSKVNDLAKKGPPAINFLPVEILSQIILQSLPNCDDRCELGEFLLVDRRTNLSTVSRFWRSAILGTPKIWSDIVLRRGPPTAAALKTQLMMSGNALFDVYIAGLPSAYYSQARLWLDSFVSSADRWQCLHIVGVDRDRCLTSFAHLRAPCNFLFSRKFTFLIWMRCSSIRDFSYLTRLPPSGI